jgi:hypothetical protein
MKHFQGLEAMGASNSTSSVKDVETSSVNGAVTSSVSDDEPETGTEEAILPGEGGAADDSACENGREENQGVASGDEDLGDFLDSFRGLGIEGESVPPKVRTTCGGVTKRGTSCQNSGNCPHHGLRRVKSEDTKAAKGTASDLLPEFAATSPNAVKTKSVSSSSDQKNNRSTRNNGLTSPSPNNIKTKSNGLTSPMCFRTSRSQSNSQLHSAMVSSCPLPPNPLPLLAIAHSSI